MPLSSQFLQRTSPAYKFVTLRNNALWPRLSRSLMDFHSVSMSMRRQCSASRTCVVLSWQDPRSKSARFSTGHVAARVESAFLNTQIEKPS